RSAVGHLRALGRLESHLLVRAVTERLGARATTATQVDRIVPAGVFRARKIGDLDVTLHLVRTVLAPADRYLCLCSLLSPAPFCAGEGAGSIAPSCPHAPPRIPAGFEWCVFAGLGSARYLLCLRSWHSREHGHSDRHRVRDGEECGSGRSVSSWT